MSRSSERRAEGIETVDWADACCDAPGCDARPDGLLDGRPLCLDCIELLVERSQAVAIAPSLRVTLPPLWER